MNFVTQITQSLQKATGQKQVHLEHPADPVHGDYATNLALTTTKKGENPKTLAQSIIAKLKSDKSLFSFISHIDIADPGFINFHLKPEILIEELETITKVGDSYGSSKLLSGQKIMVEYAHPNTHKELHIGHIRTLITGEALARILAASGARVFRANYQGDIGPHVAKSIWGTQEILKARHLTIKAAENMTPSQKAHLLGEGYVKGNQEYETHRKEIDQLNTQIYRHDPAINSIYRTTRRWSLEYYDTFYKRFDTKFDKLYFESQVASSGKKLVEKHLGQVFERSQNAIIFDGEKSGLHKRVFITADGNPTYEAKDMGLAPLQYADFPFDLNIHVVANEQAEYFKVVFKALELINPKFKGKEYHLPMGMVNLVGQKMSSRTGVVVTVDDLLDRTKSLINPLITTTDLASSVAQAKASLSTNEIESIAEAGTIAAIKYSILKADPTTNTIFDPAKSVSLEGNSGPYLQYTHARCKSVLANSKIPPKSYKLKANSLNPEELAILRFVYRFPEVVQATVQNYAPNLICNFLFDLAQKYNAFYNKHRIINAKSDSTIQFRLLLTTVTAQVLTTGLTLLGIPAPDKM